MAYRSARTERAARLAHLEQLIVSREATRHALAELGFSRAEMERAAEWYSAAARAAEPLTLENLQQHKADEMAASLGAQWLYCRMEHGRGLCQVDCPGEFRHRPAWKPAVRNSARR